MQRVTGIGGVFFKARDSKALAAWYRDHLGVETGDEGYASFHWGDVKETEQDRRTVWSLFPAESDYFSPGVSGFMINYRVANLEAMLAQLREGGVQILGAEDYDYGRFAWLLDPEGNKIELWQPREAGGSGGG